MNGIAPQTDDALAIEDVDLADDSELHRIAAEVEAMVTAHPKQTLRVSALSMDQWETVIGRLPAALRKGQELHINVLPHPRDRQHLLVSPAAVQAVNQGSRVTCQEVVSALIRALPTPLSGALRRGLTDILVEAYGQQAHIDLFARTYPEETQFVRALIRVLVADFGYQEITWALELRRNPERTLRVLRKSRFAAYWVAYANKDAALQGELGEAGNHKLALLIKKLISDEFTIGSPLARLTSQATVAYLRAKEQGSV